MHSNYLKRISQLTLAGLVVSTISGHVHASGYEKSVLWGGQSAGVGGVATPYVSGAEALFFNPAGLAKDKEGSEVSFQFSPTWSQFKGPVNNQNTIESSEKAISPVVALLFGKSINDKVGIGAGYYVAGGSKAKYLGVNFPGFTSTADVYTDLTITEFSIGGGYKVNDKLKVGLAWRIVMANAEFATVDRVASTQIANPKLTGLKDTRYDGFRIGAQYEYDEKTRFGLSWRSEVNLTAEGNISGTVITPTITPSLYENPGKVKTTFPMALTLGIQHDLEDWKLFAEYVWTQYSRVHAIDIEGIIGTTAASPSGATVEQRWLDQHNLRLGTEYTKTAWPIRAGFVYTSQVTNSDYARATFTPPAAAYTLTLGTGKMLKVGERDFQFDIAGEYSTVKGDGNGAASGASSATDDIRAGTYEAQAYALHMGLNYKF